MRSRSHDSRAIDAADEACDDGSTGRYGNSALLADSSLCKTSMRTTATMRMVAILPEVFVSEVQQ
jgi:hypothetical protein